MTGRQIRRCLTGFERLMVAYTVRRNRGIQIVPTDQLADHELDGRVEEYDRMALGFSRHAIERSAYLAARKATA